MVRCRLKGSLSVFLLFMLGACGSHLPNLPSEMPFMHRITQADEIKAGRQFRREAKDKLKFVHRPEIERYVNEVGQRILSVMGPQPFEYRFFVVEDSQVNAFAIPGGSIYVFSGLIERVTSTDELASVLGHEIIHVKAHHMARMSGPNVTSLLGILGFFLTASGSQAAGVLSQAVAATNQLSYTRKLEQEADAGGVKNMSAAGYDPNAALGFLNIIDQERTLNPVDVPPFLLTHPLSQERLNRMEAVIRSFRLERPHLGRPDGIKRIQTMLVLEKQDPEAVLEKLKKSYGQSPKSAESMHLFGLARYRKGDWGPARNYYEQARRINPKCPGIDRDLGRLYTKTGEFRLAHAAFERSVKASPNNSLNYLYLGELFEKESNLPQAVGAYLRAHNLSPLWPEPPRRMGVIYGKMDRMADAFYYSARSHLLSDEDEKAKADLRQALSLYGKASPRGQMVKEELEVIKARDN
ncbi:MAG: M48 family metalloprotease [Candidatus Binatia bacterium]